MKTVLIIQDASHYGARNQLDQHFSETQAYALLASKVEGEAPDPVTDSAVVFQCLREAVAKLISLAGVGVDNVTAIVDVEILPNGKKYFIIDFRIAPALKAAEAPAVPEAPPSEPPAAEPPVVPEVPPAEPPPAQPDAPPTEAPAPAAEGDPGAVSASDVAAGT